MTTPSPTSPAPSVHKGYKDLIIWQRSMDLAAHIYMVSQHFPEEEQHGIAAQMRYAASSIPTTIAIGSKLGKRSDFRTSVLGACSACTELETLTQIAHRLELINDEELQKVRGMFIELFGMLYKFAAALKAEPKKKADESQK